MRATINLELEQPIKLPIQYNHIINGAILSCVQNVRGNDLISDDNFKKQMRNRDLYTFSKLQGRFTMDTTNKKITYHSGTNLLISSYEDKFLTSIVNSLVLRENIKILNQEIKIHNIETSLYSVKEEEIKVYTKSPITVYKLFKVEGKNKTCYYSPDEKEFSEIIRKNLINKYKLYYGNMPKDTRFFIEPLSRKKPKESVIIYNGIVIKAWSGEFVMRGASELLNLAYQSGIGAKNSQGFGCVERIEN
ncbi:CRISPR-associated endoribonuclease Cas6 [Haloimpatiens lingqiaonensis]|uniref:CRISPR-associated endoribonuclease Cas6 n=1 Tax=Haloimpatiens lingqiaonensis TaxID=1380675 RepID=UPI0010FD5FE8|nr:CRISPR-associated endoribonuclease Cas6 [Haloimpatiens lingqiaonensis]